MKSRALAVAEALIWIHVGVNVVHGTSHVGQGVDLTLTDWLFLVPVIGIAPFVTFALLRSRAPARGALLLAASMAAALAFGVHHHFFSAGVDNCGHLSPGPWRAVFQVTAALLVLIESLGVLSGAWLLLTLKRVERAEMAPVAPR